MNIARDELFGLHPAACMVHATVCYADALINAYSTRGVEDNAPPDVTWLTK